MSQARLRKNSLRQHSGRRCFCHSDPLTSEQLPSLGTRQEGMRHASSLSLISIIRCDLFLLQPSPHLKATAGWRARSPALLGDHHQYLPLTSLFFTSFWLWKLWEFFFSFGTLQTELKSSLSITLNPIYLPPPKYHC